MSHPDQDYRALAAAICGYIMHYELRLFNTRGGERFLVYADLLTKRKSSVGQARAGRCSEAINPTSILLYGAVEDAR